MTESCNKPIINAPTIDNNEIGVSLKLIPIGVKGAGAHKGVTVNCAQGAKSVPIEVSSLIIQGIDRGGFPYKIVTTDVKMSLLSDSKGLEVVLELQADIDDINPCDGIGTPPCGTGIGLSGISTSCDETVQDACEKACDEAGGTECDIQICKSKCKDESIEFECRHSISCYTRDYAGLSDPQVPGLWSFGCGVITDKCGKTRCCPCDDGWGFAHTINKSCRQTIIDNKIVNESAACPYVLELDYPMLPMFPGESQMPVVTGVICACGNTQLKFTLLEGSGTLDPNTGRYTATSSIAELAYCPPIKIQVCCEDSDDDCSEPFTMRVTNPIATGAYAWQFTHLHRVYIPPPVHHHLPYRFNCFGNFIIFGAPTQLPVELYIYLQHKYYVNCAGQNVSGLGKYGNAVGPPYIYGDDGYRTSLFDIPTWVRGGISTFSNDYNACPITRFAPCSSPLWWEDFKVIQDECCAPNDIEDSSSQYRCNWRDSRSGLHLMELGCCIEELDLPVPYTATRLWDGANFVSNINEE